MEGVRCREESGRLDEAKQISGFRFNKSLLANGVLFGWLISGEKMSSVSRQVTKSQEDEGRERKVRLQVGNCEVRIQRYNIRSQ